MKLRFTETATRDLIRLREFIRKKNPKAAKKVSVQLKLSIQGLLEQPNMGVPVDGLADFRELIARDYIVRYRLLSNELVIVKIWHGKESR